MLFKKTRLFFGIFLLAIAAFLFTYRGIVRAWWVEHAGQGQLPLAQTYTDVENAQKERLDNTSILHSIKVLYESGDVEKMDEVSTEPSAGLPEEFNLAVPFTSQAPFEVWDELHKEACEETAMLILDAFYKNKTFTKQSAEDEIQKLIKWEIEKFGDFKDTTAEQTAQILREYFDYSSAEVVNDPTIEAIKRAVYQGNPVILPAAGRLLGNRYFRTPGPIYHMLIVRGWTKDGMIITNDPGTKHGEGFLYEPEVLMNAIHDWNAENMENVGKAMIVIKN